VSSFLSTALPASSPPTLCTQWMQDCIELTERALDCLLPPTHTAPTRLHEAMRYSVFAGGKRFRPLLCHAAGELAGADFEMLHRVAASIEMIHIFSLVQDDLPMMDDAALRHGKPTVHLQYDEATALLVCDGLMTLSFQTLSELPLPHEQRTALVRELAIAGGTTQGLSAGQYIDLASVGVQFGLDELALMHHLKTGSLMRAALRMGALCADVEHSGNQGLYAALAEYAECVGLAYQMVDDILDVVSETAILGKTAGKDALANKPTYAVKLGLENTHAAALKLRNQACASIDIFGDRAAGLRSLANFVVDRIQ
jgi:farnesyl diphosphate synthase